jgi:hypothetical protein
VHRGKQRPDARLISMTTQQALQIIVSILNRAAMSPAEAFALNEAVKCIEKATTPPPPPKTEG